MNKAVFLDRDGVINKEINYLHKKEDFEFIDGVFPACRAFQDSGYKIIVVTNQAGIGRGYYSEQDFHLLTNWMLERFMGENIQIERVKFCPHHPSEGQGVYKQNCACRKPSPKMITDAVEELEIDMTKSFLVGDKLSDILAGQNAGLTANFLVRSGHSLSLDDECQADLVINSLAEYSLFLDYMNKTS